MVPADTSQQTSGGPYDAGEDEMYAPPEGGGGGEGCGGFDSPFGGGSGEDSVGVDGGFGPSSLASGGGEVQCPDNQCSGFGTDSNGDTYWVQFNAFEGGVSGYFYGPDLTNGINIFNGQIYSDANYQLKLEQVYASQIASQCGTVNGSLSADAPANSGAKVSSCSALYIQGSHANFPVQCGSWNGGDCAGRWAGGLHIEGNPSEGFWGHNDTASYYTGSQFNWATFNPWNLVAHGVVDFLYGSSFIYMFPH